MWYSWLCSHFQKLLHLWMTLLWNMSLIWRYWKRHHCPRRRQLHYSKRRIFLDLVRNAHVLFVIWNTESREIQWLHSLPSCLQDLASMYQVFLFGEIHNLTKMDADANSIEAHSGFQWKLKERSLWHWHLLRVKRLKSRPLTKGTSNSKTNMRCWGFELWGVWLHFD